MIAVAEDSKADCETKKGRKIILHSYIWIDEAFQKVIDEIGDREFVTQSDFDKLDKIRAKVYPYGGPAHEECMPGSWTDDANSHFPSNYLRKKFVVHEGDKHGFSWLEPWHFEVYGEK